MRGSVPSSWWSPALYVVSYAADLSDALAQPSGQRLLGGAAGFVDLQAQIQQTSPNPGLGGDIDFLAGVTNVGDQTAGRSCSPFACRQGCASSVRRTTSAGSGCTGSRTIVCPLDFLAGGSSTLIRYSVQVTGAGPQTTTASVEPRPTPTRIPATTRRATR